MKKSLFISLLLTASVLIPVNSVQGQGLPVLRKDEAPSYARPADNILIIVADLQRHIADDVYRQPYAVDITGQNVFRACLVRLANYESLYSGRETDVVAMARAQAYERLCDYANAKSNYLKASKSSDSALAKKATEGGDRVDKFLKVLALPLDTSGLLPYQRDLEIRIRDFEALANDLKDTSYECLALVEKERAEECLTDLIVRMRSMAPYSPKMALERLKKIIDNNPNSTTRYAHHLALGDYYFDQAKQYVVLQDPDGPSFNNGEFQQYLSPARSEYSIVAQADGFAEKPEGRAKLAALEAFYERILASGK